VALNLARQTRNSRDAKGTLGEITFGELLKAAKELQRAKGELAWLIEFVQRSEADHTLRDLQKRQREVLAFCMISPGFVPEDSLDITIADLVRIAEKLRVGILHVISGDQEVWTVPGPARSRALVGSIEKDGRVTIVDTTFLSPVSLETRIATIAQAVIVESQDRVRICPRSGCGRLFVRVRRQEFCSIRCSDYQRKKDWRAKGGKYRAAENKLRRERYHRRKKEKP
jgi:hypothetical protein